MSELLSTRLSVALDAAQLGLWEWDLVTNAIEWDQRSIDMWGLARAGLTGHLEDIAGPIHPEDAARVHDALHAAITAKSQLDLEFRVIWPDESVHWIYARGQVLLNESGQAIRMVGTNADVTAAHRAAHQQSADDQAMAALVAVARTLGNADTEADVLSLVTVHGLSLLGAPGAVLCLRQEGRTGLRSLTSSFFGQEVRARVEELPEDFPLPMVDTALRGTSHFLGDRTEAAAAFPGCGELYLAAGTQASAAVPLTVGGRLLGSLSLGYDVPRRWREADRELLGALAAMTAQALDRISARDAARAADSVNRSFSETLQRSMLSSPPQINHLQIAVRYQPAAAQAEVGGDWYDAFTTGDGVTSVVIGDVTGHDQVAAAGMGQLRNLLRGIGYAVGAPPSRVLTTVDQALRDLGVNVIASVILADVEQSEAQRAAGLRQLRWSSAGHPPAVLINADGTAALLDEPTDLLLGVDPGAQRADHTAVLDPGCTVLLYTDGLVERRGASLSDGLRWLTQVSADLAHLPLEDFCDALLAQVTSAAEDDVALLALRAHSEAAPRPPTAGPAVGPAVGPGVGPALGPREDRPAGDLVL